MRSTAPARAGGGAPPRSRDARYRAGLPHHAWNGPRRTVSATDGHVVGSVSADRALAVARHHPASGRATNLGLVERDQWTVPQRFDPLRPFHRIALGDDADTHLYVSAVTGETALDTSRHERFWNWFGAVPHWIYFTPLRAQRDLWRDVVLWLSGLGTVGAVTGMAVGVMRVRLRRRYARGSVTPYRGWMAWHHVGGSSPARRWSPSSPAAGSR